MEIVIVDSADEVAQVVADSVASVLEEVSSPTLGLATGSSPLRVYEELICRYRRKELSFTNSRLFLLDEYVGLPPDHPMSNRTSIGRNFADHVDVNTNALQGPDVTMPDAEATCANYEKLICAAGGIDLQLLGVGSNGHIGFNEPGSSFASRTRLVTLTEQTRTDNARFFEHLDDVPRHALTQGVGTILEARHLVLVASGVSKAEPIRLAVEGPIIAMVPATALQLHPHATVVLDEAAAGRLKNAAYYRDSYRPASGT